MDKPRLARCAEELRSESAKTRAGAASTVGQLGLEAEALIPMLMDAIAQIDYDSLSLDKDVETLAAIGGFSLGRFLKAALEANPSHTPATQAAWELLARLAQAKNQQICHFALSALGLLCHTDTLPILYRVLTGESGGEPVSARARAFQTLLSIAPERADSPAYHLARSEYAIACSLWATDYRNRGLEQSALEMENHARRYQG